VPRPDPDILGYAQDGLADGDKSVSSRTSEKV
jgi:hypothetical protein